MEDIGLRYLAAARNKNDELTNQTRFVNFIIVVGAVRFGEHSIGCYVASFGRKCRERQEPFHFIRLLRMSWDGRPRRNWPPHRACNDFTFGAASLRATAVRPDAALYSEGRHGSRTHRYPRVSEVNSTAALMGEHSLAEPIGARELNIRKNQAIQSTSLQRRDAPNSGTCIEIHVAN